jgi:DNA-binding NtrC family response regulator
VEAQRRRVLVVDDDFGVLKGLVRLFEDYAEVTVAIGAEPALEHMQGLESHQGLTYDLVIVDFNMVGANGAWLLERVRARYPACERILVSGSPLAELDSHLSPGLIDHFFEKPLEIEALIRVVTGSSRS